MQTSIGRVRGLGAAGEGLQHWKLQRLTAIANVPLVLWFVFSAWALAGSSYEEVRAWLASPITASLMVLLILSSFSHARLGVQVAIEDYLHGGLKLCALIATTLVITALAVVAVVAVLIVAAGS
jgi:succinate dehydrogenase / fumarate reductase membrane anchor subunit